MEKQLTITHSQATEEGESGIESRSLIAEASISEDPGAGWASTRWEIAGRDLCRDGWATGRLTAMAGKPHHKEDQKMNLKSTVFGLLKIVLLTIAMFLSFAIAARIAGPGATSQPPEETSQFAMTLLGVCLVNTLVLAYPILRSRWHGFKLIVAVFLVSFGTETFMSQIETLFFGNAFNIPANEMRGIILSGILRALFFSPLAVAILGSIKSDKEQEEPNSRLIMPWRDWTWRLALLPAIYVCLYFLFGYFVAWQSPDVRQLYTGSTDIKPFLEHMLGVVQNTPGIFPFQLFRGLLWIGLALPIIRMMKGKSWEISLAVGLLFGLLLTTQLLLANPYMPASVRLAHFIETSTSTFIYGGLIGWLFSRPLSS